MLKATCNLQVVSTPPSDTPVPEEGRIEFRDAYNVHTE